MNLFLKNLLIKLILLCFCIGVFVGGVFYCNYDHSEDYPAAIISKYQRLDSLKNTSKIIICGGSSSCYSIDSKKLGEIFNMPVVNTSLAMSLGSYFHLNLIKDYVSAGDIIVYIPEYEYYYGKENGDDFLYTTLFYYPKIFKDFTENQKITFYEKSIRLSTEYYLGNIQKIIKKLPNKKARKRKVKKNGALQYNRVSYNYLGDNISLIDVSTSEIKAENSNRYQRLQTNILSESFVNFTNDFESFCEMKNAIFVMAFPPIEKSQFDKRFVDDIKSFQSKTNILFIGHPNDYIYEADLFFDSSYHLNGIGRKLRSEKLIETLKNNL